MAQRFQLGFLCLCFTVVTLISSEIISASKVDSDVWCCFSFRVFRAISRYLLKNLRNV